MFEYRHVGELVGVEPERRLLLPVGRPLSYLRVATSPAGELERTIALAER